MSDTKIISGSNEEEVWQQVSNDLAGPSLLEYNVIIDQSNHPVELIIDIDLGGGFEGGFEITTLIAPLAHIGDFKFAIHNEDFLDEIGKFFGMQDVVLGYPEFDKKVVVKTNNEQTAKALFADAEHRSFFTSLDHDFTFGTTESNNEKRLEFTIEKGVTNAEALRQIYRVFYSFLIRL